MGLDIGGDDYITKPFKPAVFMSRINALLRRSDNFKQADTELSSGGITIWLLRGEMYRLFHEVNSLAAILNANAEKELDRIETLVQNLLKITRLDARSIVFEKTYENMAEMMGEIEMHFSYRAKQEEKELLLSGEDNISLFCDHDWMIEALENIVKNAFDHTGKGDFLRIGWKRSASMVRIMITDNGSGIHPEDLHHIFKRFYRSRFSKDKQGIGLGLPLAKMIIEANNGTAEVDSEPGTGRAYFNYIGTV